MENRKKELNICSWNYYTKKQGTGQRIVNKIALLDLIRQKQPISRYTLSKLTFIPYPTIHQIIKEFAFCGLIRFEKITNNCNCPVEMIYIVETK